jgi:hypothetical protein
MLKVIVIITLSKEACILNSITQIQESDRTIRALFIRHEFSYSIWNLNNSYLANKGWGIELMINLNCL